MELIDFLILYSFYMGNLDFYVPKDLQISYSLLSFKPKGEGAGRRQYLPELRFVDLLCLYINLLVDLRHVNFGDTYIKQDFLTPHPTLFRVVKAHFCGCYDMTS